MKRILICGSNGLLGQRLALMLSTQTDYEVLNTSHHRTFVFDHKLFDFTQLDITRRGDVRSLVTSFQPDVILNAAARTDVDWCEEHREEAWGVNAVGVENLIDAAKKVKAQLIHVSSDYVFDGKGGPYREEDRPNPINYYGKTKLAGENALRASGLDHAIIRAMVVYGAGIGVKENFALWVVRNLRRRQQIRCATDQVSNPTSVTDLALAVVRAFESREDGLFHVCGSDRVSRYEFAGQIADVFGLDPHLIEPVRAEELSQSARRPAVTGYITLKAETALGFRPMGTRQGLSLLRRELMEGRWN
jgi:dTDP-4-dehydrorhamnose reductase